MKKLNFPFFINYINKLIYLIAFTGFSFAHAGSYDDFFKAVAQDNAIVVSTLLKRGFDPNTVDASGTAGLLLAIKSNAMNVAVVIANWPQTKAEVRNAADESPLMFAALKGELALCQILIKKDADVNKPGWAPLHYAATNGHLDVMNLLLEENAYIDAASPNGTTPLMMAAHYSTEAAVKLLLDAGADPLLKNDQGLSALDFAHRGNHSASADIISAFVRNRQPKGSW